MGIKFNWKPEKCSNVQILRQNYDVQMSKLIKQRDFDPNVLIFSNVLDTLGISFYEPLSALRQLNPS